MRVCGMNDATPQEISYPQTPQGGLKGNFGLRIFDCGLKNFLKISIRNQKLKIRNREKSPLGDLGVVLSELLLYLNL